MQPAPGWDALDEALRGLYGDQQPVQFHTTVRYIEGGPDPLDGVSVYRADGHWHYVSYGLSELYDVPHEVPEWSGFGLELSFRLVDGGKDGPPRWPADLMQHLARSVFESGKSPGENDCLDLNGPLRAGFPTRLTAVAFRLDLRLRTLRTPNGKVSFVELVGLTPAELAACKCWRTDRVLELLPHVTDPERACRGDDDDFVQAVRAGSEREGAQTKWLYLDEMAIEAEGGSLVLCVGTSAVSELQALLPGRLCHNRPLGVQSPQMSWTFLPDEEVGFHADDETLFVALTPEAARSLAGALRDEAGDYRVAEAPNLVFRVG